MRSGARRTIARTRKAEGLVDERGRLPDDGVMGGREKMQR